MLRQAAIARRSSEYRKCVIPVQLHLRLTRNRGGIKLVNVVQGSPAANILALGKTRRSCWRGECLGQSKVLCQLGCATSKPSGRRVACSGIKYKNDVPRHPNKSNGKRRHGRLLPDGGDCSDPTTNQRGIAERLGRYGHMEATRRSSKTGLRSPVFCVRFLCLLLLFAQGRARKHGIWPCQACCICALVGGMFLSGMYDHNCVGRRAFRESGTVPLQSFLHQEQNTVSHLTYQHVQSR